MKLDIFVQGEVLSRNTLGKRISILASSISSPSSSPSSSTSLSFSTSSSPCQSLLSVARFSSSLAGTGVPVVPSSVLVSAVFGKLLL